MSFETNLRIWLSGSDSYYLSNLVLSLIDYNFFCQNKNKINIEAFFTSSTPQVSKELGMIKIKKI